jgi:hypothetical protein
MLGSVLVRESHIAPANRCFLVIEHDGSVYMGCLIFDDPSFCRQIGKLLSSYCQRSIQEIGSIDVSHTLLERCNSNQGQSHRDFAESFECGFEVFEPSTRSTAGR